MNDDDDENTIFISFESLNCRSGFLGNLRNRSTRIRSCNTFIRSSRSRNIGSSRNIGVGTLKTESEYLSRSRNIGSSLNIGSNRSIGVGVGTMESESEHWAESELAQII